MQTAIPCTIMRGGTSKGLYFNAADLPKDPATRDRVLLAAMGSPDERQIDGLGGAHPLTSKVAIVAKSEHPEADVDYLFLQVAVDKAEVSDSQPCGNLLAGVGPYAIEKRLIEANDGTTTVHIRTVNNGSLSNATIQTPRQHVAYDGAASIDGVPGAHAPITLDYLDIAGANCGALLPTGSSQNEFDDVPVTCIDNGMPVVVLRAADLGLTGSETPAELEANEELRTKIESIRLQTGSAMNLGDVAQKTVPKMSIISPPQSGGALSTRTFIPHRVHDAIGVLGAVSVATACLIKGSTADGVANLHNFEGEGPIQLAIEHPTGSFTIDMDVANGPDGPQVKRAALLRTARMLMDGHVYIPASIWSGT